MNALEQQREDQALGRAMRLALMASKGVFRIYRPKGSGRDWVAQISGEAGGIGSTPTEAVEELVSLLEARRAEG